MKYLWFYVAALLTMGAVGHATIIQQEDFPPSQAGTLPSTMDAQWDAGTDVIVTDLATVVVPVDHPGGDGYVLRLGDLGAGGGGYNFAFPSDYQTASETDNSVAAWVYFDFPTTNTLERDYGLIIRCQPDPGGGVYPLRAGYWLLVTNNSSWGSYVPLNFRAFLLKRVSGAWFQIGTAGVNDYTTGWHRLELVAIGAEVRGYVDGNLECAATDSDYAAGFPVMVRYDDEGVDPDFFAASFDNFLWSKPNTTVSEWSIY